MWPPPFTEVLMSMSTNLSLLGLRMGSNSMFLQGAGFHVSRTENLWTKQRCRILAVVTRLKGIASGL